MKRLRHPIRSAREPFGKAGLTVAIVALVAAIGGTALAAAKLNSTQKKEVTSIAKKYAGKSGTNGTNGPPGEKGAAGTNGTNGTNGTDGKNGEPGEGVAISKINSPSCEGQAGVKFSNKSGEGKACNGQTGFTKTLPPGKTETGAWTMSPVPVQFRCVADPGAGNWEDSSCFTEATVPGEGNFEREDLAHTKGSAFASISFPIPLGAPLPETAVHYIKEGETTAQCTGTPEAPSAEQGNLCVYERFTSGLKTNEAIIFTPSAGFFGIPTEDGAGVSGAGIYLPMPAGQGGGIAIGAWAVTEVEG